MKKVFLFMIVLALILGCNKEDVFEYDNVTSKNEITSKKDVTTSKTITLGFNVVLTGTYDYQGPNKDRCGSFPPMVNVVNTGEGTATHFGKVTSYFDFCVDIRDFSYPNGVEEAYFMDENGDKLFVNVEGFVLGGRVPGMPSFANSYFKDPFTITGGTGRFEGASGRGMTNDYNSDKDDYSHHHWTGKITLIKN